MKEMRRFFAYLLLISLIVQSRGGINAAESVKLKAAQKTAKVTVEEQKQNNLSVPEDADEKDLDSRMDHAERLTSSDGIFEYILSEGELTITGYHGDGGELIITEKIDGYPVKAIGNSAFRDCSDLTQLILPEGLKSIGSCAISGTGIVSITVPKSLESCERDSYFNGPFAGAENLKEVIFEDGMQKIPDSICQSNSVNLSRIEKVVIPDSVTEIGNGAFSMCVALKEVELPGGLEIMGNSVFYGCKELTSIELPDTITSIGDQAFSNCNGIESIILPKGLKFLGMSAIEGTGISSLTIPSGIEECGRDNYSNGPLTGASNLKEIIFEDGIKKIPQNMCSSGTPTKNYIEKIEIPDSVTEIGEQAFFNCGNLAEIQVSRELEIIGDYAFAKCSSLSSLSLSNKITEIGSYAFSECSEMKSIQLPESLKYIGINFLEGTGVSSIVIPKGLENCEKDSYFRGPLTGADQLTEVVFEKGIKILPENICAGGNEGSKLVKVVIPESVVEIKENAFYKCEDITIYGYMNSYAENYAKENNIPFKAVAISETATASEVYKKFKSKFKIAGIDLGNTTIYGPSVTVAGQTFHLFALGANMKLNLGENIQAMVDTDTKMVHVLIGFKKFKGSASLDSAVNDSSYWSQSYRQVKSLYQNITGKKVDTNDLWRQFSSVRGKLKKVNASLGIKIDASVAGYMEFNYASGEFILNEGGVLASAGMKTSTDFRFPPCPAFYGTLGLEGNLNSGLRLVHQEGYTWHPVFNVGVELALKLGVGAGSKDLKTYVEAGVKGKAGLDIKLPANRISEALTMKLMASFFLESKVFGFDGPGFDKDFASVQIYPRTNKSMTLFGGKDLLDFDLSKAQLSERNYLNNVLSVHTNHIESSFNKTGIYEYNVPQMAQLNDGTKVLVWIDDNGTKSGINKTTLMYAVFNGTSWSSPMEVAETGGADNYPVIYSDGEKVQVVWQKAKKLSEGQTLPELLESVELYTAIFENGSFGMAEQVTANNHTYEMLQNTAFSGSNIAVVWAENSENNPFQVSGANQIKIKQKLNGNWKESIVAENLSNVCNLHVVYLDGKVAISYEVTGDAGEKIYLLYNGGTKEIDGYHSDIENGLLYYQTEEGVMSYDILNNLTEPVFSNVLSDLTVLDDGIHKKILTTEYDGFSSELVMYQFDRTTGLWSDAIKLTDEGKYIRDYSAVMDTEGNILTAINLVDVNDTLDKIYGSAELKVFGCTGIKDLIMGQCVSYSQDAVHPGAAVPFIFEVSNNGTEPVSEIQVDLLDDADQVIQSGKAACAAAPGETVECSFIYQVPEVLTRHQIKVKVSLPGETKLSDNTAVTEIGYADIIISKLYLSGTINDAKLKGTISNIGYEDAADVKALIYADSVSEGKLLGDISLGTVAAQSSIEFETSVPSENLNVTAGEEGKLLFAVAQTSSVEASEGNNQEIYVVKPLNEEPVALDYQEVLLKKGEELQLNVVFSALDELSGQPITWSVDDVSVASVNNGRVTANGNGTATVTVSVGSYHADCKVTVNDVDVVTGIYMEEPSVVLAKGSTKPISVRLVPANAGNQQVTWESENEAVAVVDKSGIVTGISAGTTEITAYTEDGEFPAICKVTVTQSLTQVYTASFQGGDGSIGSSPQVIIQETGSVFKMPENIFTNGTQRFSGWSDGENIYEAGASYRMPYHDIVFTAVWGNAPAVIKVQGITLSMSEASTTDGKTIQLIATVKPDDATDKSLKWTSDNESIATVYNGLVHAVSEGTATITAESQDGSGIRASCVVTVTQSSSGDMPGDNNKPDDNKPDDNKPSDSDGPDDNKPGDSNKPGNTKPGIDKPGSNKPGENTSGGNSSGGNTSGSNTDNSNNNGNTSGDHNKPDDSMQIKLLYYIVEFNANGGTKLSRKTMTLLNDDNLGILPKVQRRNYTFNGWYTQKTGGKKVSSSTVLNAGTTLFARWKKVEKPFKVKIAALKSTKSRQLVVNITKVTGAKGYEIAYSTKKKFPASSTKKTVSAAAKTTLKKLKSGKKYYVRARAYRLDSVGKKVYGSYSIVKSIKVK